MALVHFDGFDDGLTTAQKGYHNIGSPTVTAGVGRAGSAGVVISSGSESFRWTNGIFLHPTMVVGALMRPTVLAPGATGGAWIHFAGDINATIHITIGVTTSGEIKVWRGTTAGTLLHTSATGLVTISTQDFWEFKVVLHDSTGSVVIRKNEAVVVNLTGIDTKNGGTSANLDSVLFYQVAGLAWDIDDFYMVTGDAGDDGLVDFLGDCTATTLLPTSDSSPLEWVPSTGTSHFALVDEATPNVTDYNSSDVDGDIDMYGFADLADTTHVVYGMQVTGWAIKDDAGARSYRHRISSNAVVETSVDHALSTSAQAFVDRFPLNPDGDVAWTPTTLNAALIGVETRP